MARRHTVRVSIVVSILVVCAGLGGCVGLEGLNNPPGDVTDGGPDATVDAAAEADTSVPPPVDGGTDTNALDASDGSVGRTIACGAERCTIGDSVCCIDGFSGSRHCTGATACANAIQACDDTKDCAGLGADYICCESNVDSGTGGYRFISALCVPDTNCDPNGNQDLLCDPTAADECMTKPDLRTVCQTFTFGPVIMKACGFP